MTSITKEIKNLGFIPLLIIFLPFFSILGPAIPDIILSISAIYFIYISLKKKFFKYFKNFYFISFIFFSLLLVFQSIFTQSFYLSLQAEGSLFYFRFIFFALCVWFLIEKNENFLKYFFYSILLFISIVCFDGIFQFIFGKNIFGWPSHWDGARLSSFFRDELIFGAYISRYGLLLIPIFFLLFKKIKPIHFLIISLFLIFLQILTFISGERQAFFHVTLYIAMILILSNRFRSYLLILIIFGFALMLTLFLTSEPVKKRNLQTLDQITNVSYKYLPYSSIHEQHFSSALKMFKNNPLFGVGTNTFRYKCSRDEYNVINGCSSHPHNLYIQILGENGIIGFSFLIFWYFFLIIKLFKHFLFQYFLKKKKDWEIKSENINIYIYQFVFWWPVIPTFSFYNNWTNPILFISIGIFLKSFYEEKNLKS